MNLFFYGTLRDAALLRTVLGEEPGPSRLAVASLPDHAVLAVKGERFPMIAQRPGDSAEGVVLRDVTAEENARLGYYEGGFDYSLRQVVLSDGEPAEVFFPDGSWQGDGPWSLSRWQDEWGPIARAAAE